MFRRQLPWLILLAIPEVLMAAPLTCLQKPTVWLVGQQTRIAIGTPADCGQLEVKHPPQLQLFDRWPWRQGDTMQRFYFRATAPVAAGTISFKAGDTALEVPVEVVTWQQSHEPRQIADYQIPRTFPMAGQDEFKTGPSFLDAAALKELRAQDQPDAAVLAAGLPEDEALYQALPESTIPRACFVQYYTPSGCPVCGTKIFQGRSPFYPWLIQPDKHPWKVGCPECGRWFPSNDFAAGDMHSGEFPDDGWGYFKPGEKNPYSFVAYYAEWYYLSHHMPRFQNLANAYARSGNQRIGRAAAVMLFRVAEQYYNLALNLNMRKALTRQAVWTGQIVPQDKFPIYNTWLYVQHNWEIPRHTAHCEGYEKLWDYLNADDPELLAFAQKHHHPEIKTMADFRRFLETGYFRTVAQACLDKNLIGNLPQGQLATVEAALFLNSPRSRELVDWCFNGGGQMRYFLTNDYFIDGAAFESQGYNAGHVSNLEEIAQVMVKIKRLRPAEYDPKTFPLLTDDPKYRQIFDFCLDFNLIGRTHAQTGDSGDVTQTAPWARFQTTDVQPQWFAGPYAVTRDPRFAQALWDPKAGAPVPQVTDPQLRDAIAQVVKERGADIEQASNICDGYGHAILRSGHGDDRRALWVRYGWSRGHAHYDMLTIGLESRQRKLLPEIGYPHSWTFRNEWENNWATHYCGRVLPVPEGARRRGHCKLFADGPWARVATVHAPLHSGAAVPQLYQVHPEHLMERTIALIDLDDQNSYAVDVLRLGGGTDNYWSFHGPRYEAEAVAEGLQTEKQPGGTLAGADIAYNAGAKFIEANPHLRAWPYLYDVQRGRADQPWALDWPLQKYPDIRVRLTSLPAAAETGGAPEVALAKGKPPGGGAFYELQFAVQHDSGPAPHTSQFVSLIEDYAGERLVQKTERLPVQCDRPGKLPPVALRVTAGKRVDTIVVSREPQACTVGDLRTDGSFAVWSETGGELSGAYLVGGTMLQRGQTGLTTAAGAWQGKIVKADYRERKVLIEPAAPHPEGLVGRYVRFTNEGSDCSHLIRAARNVGQATELQLELDPRLGEGSVDRAIAGALDSGVNLHLAGMRYYHGKTLVNENGTVAYRLAGVNGQKVVYVDQAVHGVVPAEKLAEQFGDTDGDGIKRFLIYDYGVGDAAGVTYAISLRRSGATWAVSTPVGLSLALPNHAPAQVAPGARTLPNG
jgi:hypothetical protein